MRGPVKLCVALALIVPPTAAPAFGPDGHLIVGYVADEYLCTGTRGAIKPLMGSYSLGETGNWADRRKARPYNLFYGDLEADVAERLATYARQTG